MIAACESVGADLTTLTGFGIAFANTRAATVFGTGSTVLEGLAFCFGREPVRALLASVSLGKAVLRLCRRLLREINPLGLVFSPYCDPDLARPKDAGT